MTTRSIKILIADDEEGLRLSMAGILELEGYQVITAANGTEAIEISHQHAFDIAFLDIKMPGIDGVETFKAIKKLQPETVVVMMTAFAINDLITEAMHEGAYACISKPFEMDTIITTIREVADRPFILVINEDPALCTQIHHRLKDSGYRVASRSSGKEGLQLAQRKVPDIVLLDIAMQDMDGIEAFKQLKDLLGEQCPKTIMVGTQELPEKFRHAKQLGVVECLHKPLEFDAMLTVIETMTKKHQKDDKASSR